MAVCTFCPLLCEYDPHGLSPNATSLDGPSKAGSAPAIQSIEKGVGPLNHATPSFESGKQNLDRGLTSENAQPLADVSQCSLRRQSLIQLESLSRVVSRFNFNDQAQILKSANQWIAESNRIVITGRVTSIETSRAVLDLARRIHAFVDMDDSESAFHQIRAVQRSGMFTATLSEVRFRSDLVILIGNDQLLEQFPRLAARLSNKPAIHLPDKGDSNNASAHSSRSTNSPVSRTILCLGAWSEKSVNHLKALNANVLAFPMDLQVIPADLFRSTSSTDLLTSDPLFAIRNLIEAASYTSLIWSNSLLQWKHADLWVERLFQWIAQQNRLMRCVGMPLSSHYGTFQQVCNWTTGFPGRVRFLEEYETSFEPEEPSRAFAQADLEIHIDEPSLAATHRKTNCRQIFIGFTPQESNPELLHFPSLVAGYHYAAEHFRGDGTIVLRAGPEPQANAMQLSKPSDWLKRLGGDRP